MHSSSLDALLKLSKTSSPQKLFDYDCKRCNYLFFMEFLDPKAPLDSACHKENIIKCTNLDDSNVLSLFP